MNGNPRIKAVTFDLDGTLFATTEIKSRAFADLFSSYGKEVEIAVLEDHMRSEGISRFIKFRRWYEELLSLEYTDEIGSELSRRYDQIVLPQIRVAPWTLGAFEFLNQWHGRIPLFVASATPQHQLADMLHFRSAEYLITAAWGYPTTKTKALEVAASISKSKPEEVLMVGDSKADFNASAEIGARFCRFVNPESTSDRSDWAECRITNMLELNEMFSFDSQGMSYAKA